MKPKNHPLFILLVELILLTAILFPGKVSLAQDAQPAGPVYIVQSGDTLWDIAARFGVSLADLQADNDISDVNQLKVGDQLVIPGLSGIQGVLVTRAVLYGETLESLGHRYRLPVEVLVKLNRLSSPVELYAGASLILPEETQIISPTIRQVVTPGISLLELAVLQNVAPWDLVIQNDLANSAAALPGDILQVSSANLQAGTNPSPSALPEEIGFVNISPVIGEQGKAIAFQMLATKPMTVTASLLDHEIKFFPVDDHLVAIQGVHAMAAPGLYPLTLRVQPNDGSPFEYSQMIRIQAVDYPYDQPLVVDPATIDPAVTRPEDAQWMQLASPITAVSMWSGIFQLPSPLPVDYCLSSGDCWTSQFGNRRSYNGSEYSSFHTGLDIAGKEGTDVYAAAPGVVVFAGPLTVRGKATMIDHGQGVFTGYMHQSEILVQPGDHVEAGQLIGRVGATGRVEGPHLHWEVWIGGTQVDPLDYLRPNYP